MKQEQKKINRRNFFKSAGAAGLGSVLAAGKTVAEPNAPQKAEQPEQPKVARRKLGKTDVDVPELSLGTIFNVMDNQIILRKTLQWGVNYWDTADCYSGGNSELGIGKFLKINPDVRKDVFIVTKSDARDPEEIEGLLKRSLERMETNYIDLYFLHSVKKPEELNEEIKKWAQSAKQRKLIRFFGFSVHKNMTNVLNAAAKLDWIDAIMTSYNFRLMQDKDLNAAIDACYEANIGLIAMKVMGHKTAKNIETDEDKRLTAHFLKRGFTEAQAKIKAVLTDKRIATACVGRGNVVDLSLNVAAVLDKTKLTQADFDAFGHYASATCDGYCAGCNEICDSAAPDMPYVSEVMRYLMYCNSYGEKETAKELFASLPAEVRSRLLKTDYSLAEQRCPQRLPIAKLVKEAVEKLA